MSLYTSNENAFEYDGNPQTAVLQAKALKNNGPLVRWHCNLLTTFGLRGIASRSVPPACARVEC